MKDIFFFRSHMDTLDKLDEESDFREHEDPPNLTIVQNARLPLALLHVYHATEPGFLAASVVRRVTF